MKNKEIFLFLKESKKFIYASFFIFFSSLIFSYFVSTSLDFYLKNLIENIIQNTKNLSGIGLFLFIFQNNLKTSFFGMIFGLAFGVIPIFLLFINGYVVGYVLRITPKNFLYILVRLLPHGIFELPAVFISFGMGIKIGASLLNKDKKIILENLRKSLEVFIFLVLPLLFIAALIETTLIFYLS